MRKWTRMLLLAGLLALMLCGSALAADEASGICNLEITDSGYSAVAQTSEDQDVTTPSGENNVLPNTEKIKLTIKGTEASKQYLVFVLKGETSDTPKPTEGNIFYIDQQAGTGTDVVMTVYPKSLENKAEYGIYVSSTDQSIKKIGTFGYYAPYKLGDVNEDKSITATDALWALQIAVNSRECTTTQKQAADANKDSNVTATDALWILQAAVNTRELS